MTTVTRTPLTEVKQGPTGAWWWLCHACGKRKPIVGGEQSARRLLARHIDGPVHARNARRLMARRTD